MSGKIKFSHEQQMAIKLGGNSLLVSAAAGSGKTAVLTERVVEKLCAAEPVDANRLMIITYTEAAAKEMRTRITKKLRERLHTHSDPALIRRQLSLLPSAQISTIHAACLAILRQNFEPLGLDPQFSVAEKSQLTLMKIDLLDDFIEGLYKDMSADDDARTVIEGFFKNNSDRALIAAIDKISAFLETLPYPELFIDGIDSQDYISLALEAAGNQLRGIYRKFRQVADGGFGGVSARWDEESYKIALVLKAIDSGDFDGAVSAAAEADDFKTFNRPDDCSLTDWADFKDRRTELIAAFRKVRAEFLFAPKEQMLLDRAVELPVLKSLLKIADRFNGVLQSERLRERMLSFNDLERYTLKLLIESYDGKTLVKTKAAQELADYYEEIIVDEYQDCNLVQELIIRALSRDDRNIFAVGDVKQSIYRFRRAAPELFLNRHNNSEYPEGDGVLTRPSKIDLACNYRSHRRILDFINNIFFKLMTAERDIDYSNGHRLNVSDLYDKTDAASVDITLYVSSKKASAATRIAAEAAAVARKIKSVIGNVTVYDSEIKQDRKARAGDIAIIMRTPGYNGAPFEKALEREGISCINNNPSERFLDTPEVRDTLAFLQVIDNPYDDIPLITLMYSDYFCFTSNELGNIRAKAKRVLFYDAVREYAKTDKKTADFIKTVDELRTVALTASVYGLLCTLYEKTAILTRVLSQKGGALKRSNMLLLCELASGFESARYRGLFAFITYLIRLSQSDDDMPMSKLRSDPDCVRLTSIHKSKGLEFPIVFFVNTTPSIAPADKESIMFNHKLGIGGRINDKAAHRELYGLAQNVIAAKEREDGYNEYMRLLYVALTRASCRLYISGTLGVTDAIDLIRKSDMAKGLPDKYDIETKGSFMKWILFSCIREGGADRLRSFAGLETVGGGTGGFFADVVDIDGMTDEMTESDGAEGGCGYPYDEDEIMRLISRTVPVSEIPAKLSVSEIKGMRSEAEDSATLHPSVRFKKPRFLQGGVTGADRGSATHKFLQFCDFERVATPEGFEDERTRLITDCFITEKEAALVDKEGIIQFVNTDTMKKLISGYTMRKEERFMFSLPASEVLDTDSEETVTVQGVLDCLFVKDGRAVIVDYKTDRVKTEAELTDRYKVQLDLYGRAVMVNEGLVTDKKYIYSFCLKKFITL